jgi:hypothetical protein
MSFQLSPGVNVREIDLTTVIPAVATTDAAIGGVFRWGPVEKTLLVSNEDELVARFARPTNLNAETFFSAASFLAYGNRLHVSRAARTTGFTSTVTATIDSGNTVIELANTSSIEEGFVVFGEGFDEGTVVAAVNSSAIELNKEPIADGSATFLIFDDNYSFNAVANTDEVSLASHIVKNDDHFETAKDSFQSGVQFIAKYPGAIGNSLKVSVCSTQEAFQSAIVFEDVIEDLDVANTVVSGEIQFTPGSDQAVIRITPVDSSNATHATDALSVVNAVAAKLAIGDQLFATDTVIGASELLKIKQISAPITVVEGLGTAQLILTLQSIFSLSTTVVADTIDRRWEFFDLVENAPGQSPFQLAQGNTSALDEVHIVVSDENGRVTGVPQTILEVFRGLSRATDAKTLDGSSNYFGEVLNQSSGFVWYANDFDLVAPSTTADQLQTSTLTAAYTKQFIGGRDGKTEASIAVSDLIAAYNFFQSAEDIDVSLLITGKSRGGSNNQQLFNYLIDNIAERRKDCVVFGSPGRESVVGVTTGDTEQRVVNFRNSCRSSSYAVLDSGYKYMYDKYNDTFRYIPLNGDIAGLAARTDDERDAWFSPAGFNRGQIRNVVRLSFNPNQAQRDILYKNGVNPVVTFPGQGTVMFGDKTLLARPSAFDRINVRRLFIVLEKAIATSAKFTLFEFNDEFTRASFVNLVTPFLRDVQGRRGIFDFLVVCDETNNTPEIVDRNEFVGDIYIKPARSINFIQLNFVAVRTGVEFSEIIGNF